MLQNKCVIFVHIHKKPYSYYLASCHGKTGEPKSPAVARIYLPPDANCLLSVADHCLRSRDYVNLIVIDKQPQLQWLNMQDAIAHCARGLSTWQWASNDDMVEPDVVLACAGDS